MRFPPAPSLPRGPAQYEEWRSDWPDYFSAYNTIFDAEDHAAQQALEADHRNREAKDDSTFARVVGYLLLELFNRRVVLSKTPCASLVRQVGSDTIHEVVFRVGKWHRDYLLRLCAFNVFLRRLTSRLRCSPDT